MYENRQLFDFMLARIRDVAANKGLQLPQAFGRWFADMYFQSPHDFFISDGGGDGKVDLFFQTTNGSETDHCVLNTKFTERYNSPAPVAFYDELTRFWQAFANKGNRETYLSSIVRPDVRPHYKRLFQRYDEGRARLIFVTNSRRNDNQAASVEDIDVEVFHLEDVLQFMADYIEDAMPHTPPLLLTGISTVLSAAREDSAVPTSIVFARLTDFIRYMQNDPYDLLFARNIRLSLGNTPVNKEIRATFNQAPTEFVFSHNGITILCEKLEHKPGAHEVLIKNPRIVNGSQTLHSVRDVPKPRDTARVMTRIIEIPPPSSKELASQAQYRKDIVHKISIRSNLQNNIKKWDLVSNDDFQHELARFFRSKGYYYERRRKEWAYRRTELKSLGVARGPDNKGLAQLIASYCWDHDLLGPVAAKSDLAGLFDGNQYDRIREISPEVAYQIFLLSSIVDSCADELSKKLQYVASLKRHMKFVLFALVVKALQQANADWGASDLKDTFEEQVDEPDNKWHAVVRQVVALIHKHYRATAKRHRQRQGQMLPYANYFKSYAYVGELLAQPVARSITNAAKAALAR